MHIKKHSILRSFAALALAMTVGSFSACDIIFSDYTSDGSSRIPAPASSESYLTSSSASSSSAPSEISGNDVSDSSSSALSETSGNDVSSSPSSESSEFSTSSESESNKNEDGEAHQSSDSPEQNSAESSDDKSTADAPSDSFESEPSEESSSESSGDEADSSSASSEDETSMPDIERIISGMTLEEKVGQLFLMRCPYPAQAAVELVSNYHPGGIVMFARDFKDQTKESTRKNISAFQSASDIPLLIAVDEEGGTVNRVSLYKAMRAVPFWSPAALYASGGFDLVRSDAIEKAELLSSLGINVNLAPVCDISHKGSYMYPRSFGPDAELASEFVSIVVSASQRRAVGAVLKHFPGYGDNVNTHTGVAVDERSLDEFRSVDLLPFRAGIKAGAGAILVSHNIVTCIDSERPASLSPAMHDFMRDEFGFAGVIVTDDLSMDAVVQFTGGDPARAAVNGILAGNDLLCCTDYDKQYPALLEAVRKGEVPESRIDESLRRILLWKRSLGLI